MIRAALLAGILALAACSSSAPVARGESAETKVTSRVEAVDLDTRRITLKGPQGNIETFAVGPEVKRLAEIKPGDTVTTEYKVVAVAELREPTAEERTAPLVMVRGSDRAPSDRPPGAAFARAVRMVATIESVDAKTRTFVIKAPLKGTVQIHVDDAEAFSKLKPGMAIVTVYTETLLISVDK